MIQYKNLGEQEIDRGLFQHFIRRQVVVKCLRRENNCWITKDDPFIDDWSEKDYQTLVECLKNTVVTGGFVYAAFYDGFLKGFVSVEPAFFGSENQYLASKQKSTTKSTSTRNHMTASSNVHYIK